MDTITSKSAVATVRQFYDFCSAGDLEGATRLLHEDLAIHEPVALPYGGEYRCPAGFREIMGRITEQFEPSVVSIKCLDSGNPVVVRLVGRFKSRATGRSVDMDVVELHTVRDGRIVDLDVYYKDPAAIVGLGSAG
jgi:hypothetical protein